MGPSLVQVFWRVLTKGVAHTFAQLRHATIMACLNSDYTYQLAMGMLDSVQAYSQDNTLQRKLR